MIDTKKIEIMLKKTAELAEIYGSKLNLGFSGGKDSVVLKYFSDYYGIDYVANFNNTQIEQYKGMIQFIKNNYPEVNIIHPNKENSFFELMKKKGLPSLFRRWCCESLKHSNPKLSQYRVNIMGVRGEESHARLERGAVSVFGNSKRAKKTLEKLKKTFAGSDTVVGCEGGKDKVNIYPLFDLKTKEVFEIIKVEKLIIPEVYYTGTNRIGCAFCPFVSYKENLGSIKNSHNLTKAWLRVINDTYFLKKYQKNLIGKTNAAGIFYLYISGSLLTNELIWKGLRYLSEKDIFGETGLQRFERYLDEYVWKR